MKNSIVRLCALAAGLGARAASALPEAVAETAPLPLSWLIAPIASVAALVVAGFFYRSMIRASEGTDRMKEIASYVRTGARAYLRQQYKVVFWCFVVAGLFFAFLAFVLQVQSKWVPFAFLTGGFFSGLCGFIG